MARNRKRRSDRRPHGASDDPSPESGLAPAQVALGRPELADPPSDEELAREAVGAGGRRGGESEDEAAGREPVPAQAGSPAPRAGARLINFLQGSWRELQRVQWPDRRQVMQATGVVIGFVIVAGVFLGVADLVASKVINLILK